MRPSSRWPDRSCSGDSHARWPCFGQLSRRTTIRPWRPGSGKDAASAATASRSPLTAAARPGSSSPDRRAARCRRSLHPPAGHRATPAGSTARDGGRCRLPVAHPPVPQQGVQAGGQVFGSAPAVDLVGERPQREHGKVAGGDDEDVAPRPPQLDQGRVLPRRRPGLLHPGMDRQQGASWHAVLQPRPRRAPKRAPPGASRWSSAPTDPHRFRSPRLPRTVQPRPLLPCQGTKASIRDDRHLGADRR
jgi:hypothetical protein